jgi:hypothetical protein
MQWTYAEVGSDHDVSLPKTDNSLAPGGLEPKQG